jgi:LPXTG-motif cell wall-anchored protein
MVVERSRRKSATSLAGIAMILVGTLTMVLGVGASVAGATKPNPEHKVTLCHRTDSRSNPYVEITVDVATVLKTKGHDSHNGPIFSSSLPKHAKWGDVIPPFDFGPGEQYAGQNWTSDGQAILANGCSAPGTTTTSTSTTTSTTEPGDTTTTTASTTTTTSTSTSTTETTTTTTSTTLGTGPVVTQGGPGTPIGPVVTVGAQTGSATLPRTGSSLMVLFSAGLALVVSGIGLVIRRRRWAS